MCPFFQRLFLEYYLISYIQLFELFLDINNFEFHDYEIFMNISSFVGDLNDYIRTSLKKTNIADYFNYISITINSHLKVLLGFYSSVLGLLIGGLVKTSAVFFNFVNYISIFTISSIRQPLDLLLNIWGLNYVKNLVCLKRYYHIFAILVILLIFFLIEVHKNFFFLKKKFILSRKGSKQLVFSYLTTYIQIKDLVKLKLFNSINRL